MSSPPASFFAWNNDYGVQNEVLDYQHQQMVRLVGELHASVQANESGDARAKRLTCLHNFSQAHFAVEERLLRTHSYPRYLFHKAAHEGLAHALKGLREDVVSGKRELTIEYVELIKLWLIDHFIEFDRVGASFLSDENDQGQKVSTRAPTAQ